MRPSHGGPRLRIRLPPAESPCKPAHRGARVNWTGPLHNVGPVPPRLLFDGPRVRSTSLPSSPEALFACLRRFPRAANWAQRALRGSQPPLERGDENVERNPILAAARNGRSEGVTARPPTGRLPIRGRREAMIVRSLRRSYQSQGRSSRPRGGLCDQELPVPSTGGLRQGESDEIVITVPRGTTSDMPSSCRSFGSAC
jgi:hypothetical protein